MWHNIMWSIKSQKALVLYIYIYIYILGFRVYSCLGTFILAEKIHEYHSHTFKTHRNNSNICFTRFLFISYSYFFLTCWDRRRCLFLECPLCFLVFNWSCSAKEEKEKKKKKKSKVTVAMFLRGKKKPQKGFKDIIF